MTKIIKGPWGEDKPESNQTKDGVKSLTYSYDGRPMGDALEDLRENYGKDAKIDYFMDEDIDQYYCVIYSGYGGYDSYVTYKIFKDGEFVSSHLPNYVYKTSKDLFLQNLERYTKISSKEIESKIYGFRLRLMRVHGDSKKKKD